MKKAMTQRKGTTLKKRILNKQNLQSEENKKYSGTELLINGEDDLSNYNEWIVESFLHHYKVIKPLMNRETMILDFGAGIGTLSKLFLRFTGIRPDCVEIDTEQREIIKEMGFESYSALDEVNKKYDLIFSSNVLEHIEDDVQVLSELSTKLSKNGVLMIYVPAFDIIWTSLDTIVGHHRRYKKETLIDKLEKCGFSVKHSSYCDSLGFLLAVLYKFIGKKNSGPSSSSLRFFDRFLLPISKAMDVIVRRTFGKNLLVAAVLSQE